MNWFDANFYLESKLAQLKAAGETAFKTVAEVKAAIEGAGMTVEEHFMQYHTAELTSPCAEFNTTQYINAKVAQLNADAEGGRTDWTFEQVQEALEGVGGAYQHYELFGSKEGINPSNDFDASAYLAAKATAMGGEWTAEKVAEAIENAGMSVLDHFKMFAGKGDAEVAADASFEVPAGEQVSETPVQPTPENPVEALIQSLEAAEAAKAEFLKGLELDVNGDKVIDDKDVVDDAAVADNQTKAQTELQKIVTDYDASKSDRVNNAFIQDKTDELSKALSDDKTDVADATAAIAKVEGLNNAIDALAAAKEVQTAANAAKSDADAELTGAIATFESREASDHKLVEKDGQYYLDNDDSTDQSDGDTAILSEDEEGTLVVNADWAEANKDNASLLTFANELLAAVNAAAKAATDATEAGQTVADAIKTINALDLNEAALTKLDAVAKLIDDTATDMPSLADIDAHEKALDAVVDAKAEVVENIENYSVSVDENSGEVQITDDKGTEAADDDVTLLTVTDGVYSLTDPSFDNDDVDALIEALNAVDTFDKAVEAFHTAADAENPRQAALDTANTELEGSQAAFDALTDALADLKAADEYVDQLAALDAAIKAAGDAFGEAGYTDVIDVDGPKTAGEDSDIFFAADTDAAIADFGKAGDDVLFVANAQYNDAVIGSEEGQTALTEAGDNNVVEFFLEQSGDNVIVHIEQNAYASATAADDTTDITLTGVQVADLAINDGFITMA